MAPDRSKAGGNRNRPDILTDPRAIQRVHLDHHQISSHQNVVKTIKDTPITDLADVEVDKTSDDFAAGQSLVWGGDSWIAGDPEVLIPVKAAEEMTKGTPVYVSDEHTSGKPIVSKADSDGTDTYPAIGLLLTDLAAGAEGHAVGGGILSGLDTDAYTVGNALYLSSSPGVLRSTRPTATNEKVQKVAVVARSHAEAGTVIVMGAGRTNDIPNDLVTLTGVSLGDSDLGTFTGATIADNETIKGALQDLETAVEAGGGGVKYHGRYDTEAETARSGATTTTEIYYTARPDGDGYAESEVTTSTPAGAVIRRRLYYSDKFDADPDTSGDWTAYTTQPADDTAFATAKAALLAGLSDTDGTANTRGTLPVSLKMEHQFVTDLLLEDYPGATAAYSVRKIRYAYTGSALRVREDSGNTETDIGFDSNGDLDTAAIASHCGSANGYVVTWYDQSGSGNDVTQSTTTKQPQIYNGTAVITRNGKPAVHFFPVGSLGTGLDGVTLSVSNRSRTIFAVQSLETTGPSGGAQVIGRALSSTYAYWSVISGARFVTQAHRTSGRIDAFTAVAEPVGTQILKVDVANTSNLLIYKNGTQVDSRTDNNADWSSTAWGLGGLPSMGNNASGNTLAEVVMYESDQLTNRTGIEGDINTYYQTQTQLLIDTYSGAAAAYSVRKLSQWYTGSCMRIREDSGNTETDIGFDSNGDLDTAAIKSFCDAAGSGVNGYVVTWYDQSGNGQDVTQATAANQPQIYNGTAVLTDNGKPCVEFDGSNDLLTATNTAFSGTSQSMFLVNNADAISGNPFRAMVCIGPVAGYKMRILTHGPGIRFEVVNNSVDWAGSPGSQNLLALIPDGGATTVLDYDLYQDGSLLTPTATNQTQNLQDCAGGLIKLGYNFPSTPGSSQYHFDGKLQEVILYNNDQSANRTGFESNINTYFSIYP